MSSPRFDEPRRDTLGRERHLIQRARAALVHGEPIAESDKVLMRWTVQRSDYASDAELARDYLAAVHAEV